MVIKAILQICPATFLGFLFCKDNPDNCCKNHTSQNQYGHPPLTGSLFLFFHRSIVPLDLNDGPVHRGIEGGFLLEFFSVFVLINQRNGAGSIAVLTAIFIAIVPI